MGEYRLPLTFHVSFCSPWKSRHTPKCVLLLANTITSQFCGLYKLPCQPTNLSVLQAMKVQGCYDTSFLKVERVKCLLLLINRKVWV